MQGGEYRMNTSYLKKVSVPVLALVGGAGPAPPETVTWAGYSARSSRGGLSRTPATRRVGREHTA